MPGFYASGEYDVAGFIVGIVSRSRIVNGKNIVAGDVLIGLPSSGLHTNGYSLARRIAFDTLGLRVDSLVPELGTTVGEALLRTHRSYLRVISPMLERGWIKGMAHITGAASPKTFRACFRPDEVSHLIGTAGRCRRCFAGFRRPATSMRRRCFVPSTWASVLSSPARRGMRTTWSRRLTVCLSRPGASGASTSRIVSRACRSPAAGTNRPVTFSPHQLH
jgi:hypothetical protein